MSLHHIVTRATELRHLEDLMLVQAQAALAGHSMEARRDGQGTAFIRCTGPGCRSMAFLSYGFGLTIYHISTPCGE